MWARMTTRSKMLRLIIVQVLFLLLVLLHTGVNAAETCSGSGPEEGTCKGEQQEPELLSAVPSRSGVFVGNLETNPLVNEVGQRPIDNSVKVTFTLHPNGDGLDQGIEVNSQAFKDIDAIIGRYCCDLMRMDQTRCFPGLGARLVTEVGVRMLSFNDVENGQRVYCVPQGLHFVWPTKQTGHSIYPKNVKAPIAGRPIRLKQLSEQVKVFSVDNFVSDEEIDEILRVNRKRMQPSEVGFGGWQDDTRTSSTSWDFSSKASLAIQKRTFQILSVDFDENMADTLQVLRYTSDGHRGHGQWYKPHVDWFHSGGYDGHDPKVNNGTNRFATMFLYLSNVEKGGATVFPLSTTHEGYNGEKLVHDGTMKTPGYIDTNEARYCCNETSTALRAKPVKGNAVLFYSQGPDGTLDPWSLHGGCPPIQGEKWSANVWIWNRPKPDKSAAKDIPKDAAKKKNPSQQQLFFFNRRQNSVDLLWDANAPGEGLDDYDAFTIDYRSDLEVGQPRFKSQGTVQPGNRGFPVQSYLGHVFIAVDKAENRVVWVGAVKSADKLAKNEWNGEASDIRYSVINVRKLF